MKYEVLKDFRGSPDGCRVIDYKKGQVVDIVDSLAEVALAEKWVKPSKAAKAQTKAEAEASAKASAIAALQAELAQLKADYEAAPEADRAAIVAQAEAKQAELDALLA